MGFCLRNAEIIDAKGHGINIEGFDGAIDMSDVTVRGAGGDGIRVIGSNARRPLTIPRLIGMIEARLQDFPAERRAEVLEMIDSIRANPNDAPRLKRYVGFMSNSLGHASESILGRLLTRLAE